MWFYLLFFFFLFLNSTISFLDTLYIIIYILVWEWFIYFVAVVGNINKYFVTLKVVFNFLFNTRTKNKRFVSFLYQTTVQQQIITIFSFTFQVKHYLFVDEKKNQDGTSLKTEKLVFQKCVRYSRKLTQNVEIHFLLILSFYCGVRKI